MLWWETQVLFRCLERPALQQYLLYFRWNGNTVVLVGISAPPCVFSVLAQLCKILVYLKVHQTDNYLSLHHYLTVIESSCKFNFSFSKQDLDRDFCMLVRQIKPAWCKFVIFDDWEIAKQMCILIPRSDESCRCPNALCRKSPVEWGKTETRQKKGLKGDHYNW